ncbi:MAG: AlpA family phage regulatory protein [Deltaproteobacteria bacterium]|nr:MAG: AlpA family phage regulatory protein [Deltaproteobacteria bacterium]
MANCKKRIQTDSLPPDLMQRWGPKRRPPIPDEAPPVRSEAIRILRLPQVLNVTGLAKTKIYELQSQGTFPMRIQITGHSVGWIEHEVQAWLAQRAAARSDDRRETVANAARASGSLTLRCPRG